MGSIFGQRFTVADTYAGIRPARAHRLNDGLSLYNESAAGPIRAKIASLNEGGIASLVCVGDSETAGWGATRATSWPSQLAADLTVGAPDLTGVWHGLNPQYGLIGETRLSSTGAITYVQDHTATMASGATITWTGTTACTAIEVHYLNLASSAAGAFTVKIDAAAPVTVTPTQTMSRGIYRKTGLASTPHTVVITATQANALPFAIVEETSATSGLHLTNAGYGGTFAAQWDSPIWVGPWAQSLSYGADIIIVSLGVNEANFGVDPETYRTALRNILTRARTTTPAVGVLVEAPPAASAATWSRYVGVQYDLADELNLPLWDATARFVSAAQGQALGLYADDTHPSQQGYGVIANMVAAAFSLGTVIVSGGTPPTWSTLIGRPAIVAAGDTATSARDSIGAAAADDLRFGVSADGSVTDAQVAPDAAVSLSKTADSVLGDGRLAMKTVERAHLAASSPSLFFTRTGTDWTLNGAIVTAWNSAWAGATAWFLGASSAGDLPSWAPDGSLAILPGP